MPNSTPSNVDDLPLLPARAPDAHKGHFGRALLVGGSRGMSGAISLAGIATLRSGAGLVTLAVPEPCLTTVASFEPSYMTMPLAADARGRIAGAALDTVRQAAREATCLAIGPGLGRSAELTALVGRLYAEHEGPAVVDADGLNALAKQFDTLPEAAGPRILTPHPGEFARLTVRWASEPVEPAVRQVSQPVESTDDWLGGPSYTQPEQFAAAAGVVLVLKGHRTLITDGRRSRENTTGNPGMATGGSGDVLTGVITGLVCQGLAPWDAARLGVYVHGLAGDLGAARLGQVSLIAGDLLRFLPAAFAQLDDRTSRENASCN